MGAISHMSMSIRFLPLSSKNANIYLIILSRLFSVISLIFIFPLSRYVTYYFRSFVRLHIVLKRAGRVGLFTPHRFYIVNREVNKFMKNKKKDVHPSQTFCTECERASVIFKYDEVN